MTRFTKTLAIGVIAAALAAPAAVAQPAPFVQGVTDFPKTMPSQPFVPGVTDFGKTTGADIAYPEIVLPAKRAAATVTVDASFAWAAAGIGAATGLALGALGLAAMLAVRRRVSGVQA